MKICVLGGDGYCGWPTALYLSNCGHEVAIADSFARRRWDLELSVQPLIPIQPLSERTKRWEKLTGRRIRTFAGEITDYEFLSSVMSKFAPEAVIHFAEQKSAFFSMIDRKHSIFSQTNNMVGTSNVLFALREISPDCHLVRIGNGGQSIVNKSGLSFSDSSGINSCQTIRFACGEWKLRVTELNQGVVFGALTDEVALHVNLANRLDYDEAFGTSINRFCVQAAVEQPLRARPNASETGLFDIRDTVKCIELACLCPPFAGEYRIVNQYAGTFSEHKLVSLVRTSAVKLGLSVEIDETGSVVERNETHQALRLPNVDLGFRPHTPSESVDSLMNFVFQSHSLIRPNTLSSLKERLGASSKVRV